MSADLATKRPTAPTLWFEADDRVFALPMTSLSVEAELYVSTALVRLTGKWVNSSSKTIDAIFALPFHGSVASVSAQVGPARVIKTAMVSNEEAAQFRPSHTADNEQAQAPRQSPYERFIPDLFRLPVTQIKPKEEVSIEVHFIESLQYSGGQYHFRLQLAFSSGMIPNESKISDIVKIRCIINAISKDTRVSFKSC
jgi:hypothetical protein